MAAVTGAQVNSGIKAAKWIPPLPRGWEARYDEGSKAYFFIDHINKKTQWDDPRFNRGHAAVASPQRITSGAAASSLGNNSAPVNSQKDIAMKELRPNQQANRNHQSQNESHIREASLSAEVDPAIVAKLKAEFPQASNELITDMLAVCHNNERETREQLNDFGYLTTNNSARKLSNSTSPHRQKPSARKSSTEAHGPTHSAASSPAKASLSEADKKRLAMQVKDMYPKLDDDIIRLALIECHYNLEEVKFLLTAWEKRGDNKENSRPGSSKSGNNSSVSSSAHSVQSVSVHAAALEPTKLDERGTHLPTNPDISQASVTKSPRHVVSAKEMGTSRSSVLSPKKGNVALNSKQMLNQTTKSEDLPASKSSLSHHVRAKQVTKMSEHLLNTTNDLLNHLATTASCCSSGEDLEEREAGDLKKLVKEESSGVADEDARSKKGVAKSQPAVITVQPVVQSKPYPRSQYRTEAKGPDASLRNGPNSSLLATDYTQPSGPDQSNCVGPDQSRLTGSQGATGPDKSLRCGPQSCLLLQENKSRSFLSASVNS